MKHCIRCGGAKPLSEYYTHPRMTDGRLNKCKECCKSYARAKHHRGMNDPAWVAAQRERGREKHKRLNYTERYRDKAANSAARTFRKRYPEKAKAHAKVQYALRVGRIVRPGACQDCGETLPLHGHHEDYSRPLEVVWLCRDCHMKRHRKAA
jgi:hypothetical protein